MKVIFRALVILFAIGVITMLSACKPKEKATLRVAVFETEYELVVQLGEPLPFMEPPQQEGYTFCGWEQNETPFDGDKKLTDLSLLRAKFIKDTEGSDDLIFKPTADGRALAVVGRSKPQHTELIIPSFVMWGEQKLPVTEIADNAFASAELTQIVLPSMLTKIGAGAFCGATMPHFYLPSHLTEIGENAFLDASGFTLMDLPQSATTVAAGAFLNSSIRAFRTHRDAKTFVAKQGVLYWDTMLHTYPSGATEKYVKVADGTTALGAQCFENALLSQVDLPDTVTEIGQAAFRSAHIETLDTSNIMTLGNECFFNAEIGCLRFGEGLSFIQDFALEALQTKRIFFRSVPMAAHPGVPHGVIYTNAKNLDKTKALFPTSNVADERLLQQFAPVVIDGVVVDVMDEAAKVTVAKSVVRIEHKALYREALTAVVFKGAPPKAEGAAFYRNSDLTISVPEHYLSDYQTAFYTYRNNIVPYDAEQEVPGTNTVQVRLTGDGIEDEVHAVPRGSSFTLPLVQKEGFRFVQWEQDGMTYPAGYRLTLTENKTFTAVFQANIYKVEFYANGVLLKTDLVAHGNEATAPIDVPIKPSDEQFDYIFIGWDTAFDNVTFNLTVTAKYKQIPKQFTVQFYANGTLLKAELVAYGNAATAPTDVPAKPSDKQFDYVFIGWDTAFDNVTSNLTVTAKYKQIPKQFTVQFYANGVLLKTDLVAHGTAATAPTDVPIKPSDKQFDHIFIGWDTAFDNVTSSLIVTAKYKQIPKQFTVQFYANGTLLKTEQVGYGNAATAPTDVPAKPSDKQFDYVFIGWDTTFGNVTSNLTVTAKYKQIPKQFTIQFYANGTLLKTEQVGYGNAATAPIEVPTKPSDEQFDYVFIGWDTTFDNVTSDLSVTAVYKTYLKEFLVVFYFDGKVIEARRVWYGAELGALPTATQEGFVLDGFFDINGVKYTQNTVITANVSLVAKFTQTYDPYAFTKGLEFDFDFDTNVYVVSLYWGDETDVVIPSRYRGDYGDYPVEALGRALFESKYLTSVVIPEGIKEIQDGAFMFVTGLTELVLPASLTYLGNEVFYGAEQIKLVFLGQYPLLLQNEIKPPFAEPTKSSDLLPSIVIKWGSNCCTKPTKYEAVSLH